MNEAEPMMLWLPSLTGSDKLEGLQGPPLATFLVLRNVTRRISSSRSFLFSSPQSLHPNLPPAHVTLTNVTPYLHQARSRLAALRFINLYPRQELQLQRLRFFVNCNKTPVSRSDSHNLVIS